MKQVDKAIISARSRGHIVGRVFNGYALNIACARRTLLRCALARAGDAPAVGQHQTRLSGGCEISMSINTCPIATVEAPVERVWQFLADPHRYDLWWDAETRSIEPAGPAKSGQRICAQTRALGKDWDVQITVESIDSDKRHLDLTTQLPFGIMVHNHIVCTALDNRRCRVSFG